MGFIDNFINKETTKVYVEVFKGKLEKAAILDSTKKEFAENTKLKESILLSTGASEKIISSAKEKLTFELNLSEDFQLSYLLFVTNENRISKMIAIITEGIEEDLHKLLENNQFILRIQR